MKKEFLLYLFLITIFFFFTQLFGQRSNLPDPIEVFVPTPHNIKLAKYNSVLQSFYQQKDNWQQIIDSTWGPGAPLENKLKIFDSYVKALDDNYPCFPNLAFSWDSLKNHYRNEIDSTTSRGRFAAIMGHLSYSLSDAHTLAIDSVVAYSPLNPGTPILILGSLNDIKHFGATLTILEDSSIAVLKVVDNHPLNIEPGDMILGYEGMPWQDIIEELMLAELPIAGNMAGCESAKFDAKMICAGMNWHLFETIDIKKHSTGQIINLPTSSMLSLVVDKEWLLNNEQLEISNVPFPDWNPILRSGPNVTYGILENTNIGFIYLFAEDMEYDRADKEFFEAVDALKETDGLIIDMRYNRGGWAFFEGAFDILFNYPKLYTIADVYRCSPDNWNLCIDNLWTDGYAINSDPYTFFEKPIAVLTGPACVSMGDITLYRLKYHPNVRLFGKSSNASLSDNERIRDYDKWYLRYAVGDMVRLSDPNYFLNQKEVPIDYPMWFSLEDITNNYDTVLEEAKKYVSNLAQSNNASSDKVYSNSEVTFTADVFNPNEHELSITANIENDSMIVDSINCEISNGKIEEMIDLSIYPEDLYSVSIITENNENSTNHMLPNIVKCTNAGPLVIDTFTVLNPRDSLIAIKDLYLKNLGDSKEITTVIADLISIDSSISGFTNSMGSFGDIPAGESKKSSSVFAYNRKNDMDTNKFILVIRSGRIKYWTDTLVIVHPDPTDIALNNKLPIEYGLEQNYPNPFNPSTRIKYSIPVGVKSEKSKVKNVMLKIYDILGREVVTLINEEQKPGYYEVTWDAGNYPSGVYLYKLRSGEFTKTRKMLLIK